MSLPDPATLIEHVEHSMFMSTTAALNLNPQTQTLFDTSMVEEHSMYMTTAAAREENKLAIPMPHKVLSRSPPPMAAHRVFP
jgi:hypothetical protein